MLTTTENSNKTRSNKLATPAPAKPVGAPDVFDFKNYRAYLSQWFLWKKQVTPNYSGAVFARKAGISSHTLLGMVIRGDRNLSATTIRGFCRAIPLSARQAMYFEKLVLFNQSKNSEDKSFYLEQALTLAHGRGRTLLTKIKNHASYLSHWYVVAIRELVHFPNFSADPDWIARKLKRKITRRQAEEAVRILLELGLIAKSGEKFKVVNPSIDIDPGNIDFAIRNYHKEFLDRAKDAVDGEPLDERELSSLTLALSEKDMPLLRERIKEFRKNLNMEFPVSETPPEKIVAVNTQMLILTDDSKEQRK